METKEYDYELEDFDENSKKCVLCDKRKVASFFKNIDLCRECSKDYFITKTDSKKIYKLTDDDLNDFDYQSYRNSYRGETHLYFLKDIRMKSIEKKYKTVPNNETEYKYLTSQIIEDYENKEKNKKPRKCKVKMNYEPYEYEDYERDYYFNEENLERKSTLENALKEKGLKLRDDSVLCKDYIRGNRFDLDFIVNVMVSMDFFMKKTDYGNIMRNSFNNSESYKHSLKIKLLKRYVKNNSLFSVPIEVFNALKIKNCYYMVTSGDNEITCEQCDEELLSDICITTKEIDELKVNSDTLTYLNKTNKYIYYTLENKICESCDYENEHIIEFEYLKL